MIATLTNPLPAHVLRSAAAPFSVQESARAYLDALGV